MGLWRRVMFGSGRMSAPLRDELLAEGPELLIEGLPGWLVYRSYRAPGVYMTNDIESTAGAIALTPRRLVVWLSRGEQRGKHIDVPRELGRAVGIAVHSDRPGRVVFSYNPADFHSNRSGHVEIRLRTEHTPDLLRRLASP